MDRKRLSGASFRKKSQEKAQKLADIVSKTKKINNYFSITNSGLGVTEVPSSSDSNNELLDTDVLNLPIKINNKLNYLNASNAEQHLDSTTTTNIEIENSVPKMKADLSSPSMNKDASMNKEMNDDHPGYDPALWKINKFTIEYLCKHGFSQDLNNLNFAKSKRAYTKLHKGCTKTYYRFCNKNYWNTTLANGDKIRRNCIVYSESKGVVYCISCLLFGNIKSPSFASKGFSNWKRADELISQHENSLIHRSNVLAMKKRGQTLERIDLQLIQQIDNERAYWVNVLKRVAAIVKSLASRGLSFRGHTSKIGCLHNGNFLMALELLAEFDPFISNHIVRYGNPGKGHTSYLSYNIYEQFILLMSKKVESTIVQYIHNARYFSISVDSTPDITHSDQLSLVVRYVDESGQVFERFLCFIDNVGHKSENMAEAVLAILQKYNLNIKYLRGQSYDNARNMSGIYSGLQARIQLVSPLAKFVPCSAHSLNLVGQNAASCCKEAIHFFDFLQNLYTFFSASTYRWQILNTSVKSLSKTRWSARDDACYSLNRNWTSIENALTKIEKDEKEKPAIRCEANGLLKKLLSLESSFLSIFWGDILHRFNTVSKKLQDVNTNLGVVVELYDSLINYVGDIRTDEDYKSYENRAMEKCGIKNFKITNQRQIKRKTFSDDSSTDNITTDFKVNTYFFILDQLKSELLNRKKAYDNLMKNYYFFLKITEMTSADIRTSAELLRNEFNTDLGTSFSNECIHFSSYLKTISNPPKNIQDLLIFIKTNELKDIYPYVDIALKMLLCTPVSNSSTERSFSALKRIKSYLRSRVGDERLSALAIMNIEADITTSINYDDIIQQFAQDYARRKF